MKPHKFQKVARPLRTPPQGGTPPLKSPLVYVLVPRRGEKPLVFFTVFCILQFGLIIIILTLFAQVMVSKAIVTNYDA